MWRRQPCAHTSGGVRCVTPMPRYAREWVRHGSVVAGSASGGLGLRRWRRRSKGAEAGGSEERSQPLGPPSSPQVRPTRWRRRRKRAKVPGARVCHTASGPMVGHSLAKCIPESFEFFKGPPAAGPGAMPATASHVLALPHLAPFPRNACGACPRPAPRPPAFRRTPVRHAFCCQHDDLPRALPTSFAHPTLGVAASFTLLLGLHSPEWASAREQVADRLPFTPGGASMEVVRSETLISPTGDGGTPCLALPDLSGSTLAGPSADEPCACKEPYGLLPCSVSLSGNMFLITVYGYLLLRAAQLISAGSELLLEVMNPGLIGGLLLPLLGALPDCLLIAVSGLRGTQVEAQDEVAVGMGILAGSSIMLQTVAWAGSTFLGLCDLAGPNGAAVDRQLTRGFDPWGTGVTTDEQTRWGAWIMLASTLPFLVVQVPLLDGHPAEGPEAAALGCGVALLGLLAYMAYQVVSPWLQTKRIQEARLQLLRSQALRGLSSPTFQNSLQMDVGGEGNMTPSLLREMFAAFDANRDGRMSRQELRTLIIALQVEEQGSVPSEVEVETWLHEFDLDADAAVSEEEFVAGVGRWMRQVAAKKKSRLAEDAAGLVHKNLGSTYWAARSDAAKELLDLLEQEGGSANEREEAGMEAGALTDGRVYLRAAGLILAGVALVSVFADPLVDAIGAFADAARIPSFYVAFVVAPFATNASEILTSFQFALGKQRRNISLTFSQIFGTCTMNNTLCLGLFLLIVYLRGLTWDFSSEVTVVLICTAALGVLGGTRTTFPLYLAGPILVLYPLSIGAVSILDNYLGWH